MYYNAKEPLLWKSGYEVTNVVDGDGLILFNIHSGSHEEFRLYGIDAPEIKKCRKLVEDERKLHLPGQLLIKLGYQSMNFLKNLAVIGSRCTIAQEKNSTDFYNRSLAYVYLENNICINEIMITEGYAKPFNDYYCSQLHYYQKLNVLAKKEKKGLYGIIKQF